MFVYNGCWKILKTRQCIWGIYWGLHPEQGSVPSGPPSLLHCWVTLVTQPCHLCGCIRFLSISDWMAYFCISLLSSFLCFSDLSPYKQDTVRFCFLFKSSLSFAAFCSVVISIISTIFGVTTIVLQFISSYSHVLCIPSPLLKYSLLYFILYVCERNKGNRKPSLWHCNNNGYSQDVLIKAKINGQNLKGKGILAQLRILSSVVVWNESQTFICFLRDRADLPSPGAWGWSPWLASSRQRMKGGISDLVLETLGRCPWLTWTSLTP